MNPNDAVGLMQMASGYYTRAIELDKVLRVVKVGDPSLTEAINEVMNKNEDLFVRALKSFGIENGRDFVARTEFEPE